MRQILPLIRLSKKERQNMNRALGLALIVVGGVLIFYGFRANDSFSSEVSRFFSGNPTHKTVWYFICGAASAIVGLVLTAKSGRSGN